MHSHCTIFSHEMILVLGLLSSAKPLNQGCISIDTGIVSVTGITSITGIVYCTHLLILVKRYSNTNIPQHVILCDISQVYIVLLMIRQQEMTAIWMLSLLMMTIKAKQELKRNYQSIFLQYNSNQIKCLKHKTQLNELLAASKLLAANGGQVMNNICWVSEKNSSLISILPLMIRYYWLSTMMDSGAMKPNNCPQTLFQSETKPCSLTQTYCVTVLQCNIGDSPGKLGSICKRYTNRIMNNS